MGSPPSKIENEDLATLSKNLLSQFVNPKVSEKFQKAQFFYKTREMKINIPVDNKDIITEWQQSLKNISDVQIKKYILFPKQYEFENQGICGSLGLIKIVYDYFPYSLQGEVQNRKKSITNDEFTEAQIWKLLVTLLKACHLMHLNWKKVGDIRPKNILLNQQKQIRVNCHLSNPRQLNNYQKFLFQKQATYLAPQEIHDLKMGRIQSDTTRNAKQHIIEAESWSVGLTLLHITLLFNFQLLYEPMKKQNNLDLLRQKILDLQKNTKISLALTNIIRGMVQEIPERRLLCSELLLIHLVPYIDDIQNLRSFDSTKLNIQIKELMQKKSVNSLIGIIWKATSNGLIQSLFLHTARQQEKQIKAKQTLIEQLDKFSQIPPKHSQVSMRQSIRLGGSIRTLRNSLSKIKTSQVSNQSFHTVNSKKSSVYQQQNKISTFNLQTRFATGNLRLPTISSPVRSNNLEGISDKFTTPLGQSFFFNTIHGNQKSFDSNQLGVLSSAFKNSQTIQDKNTQKIENGITQQSLLRQGNFKKKKGL